MLNSTVTEVYVEGALYPRVFNRDIMDMVLKAYQQDHRKYHTLEHLECMLRHAQEPEDPLLIAIALHDLVYFPYPVPPGKNELYSLLGVPIWSKTIPAFEIKDAILATAFYFETQNFLSPLAQELCDLDLCNLALPWEDYCYWSNLAIEEAQIVYKDFVSHPLGFKYGQYSFLSKILQRDKLYYHHTEWEDQARTNMEKRKKLLQKELDSNEKHVSGNGNSKD
jgi:predicted metal-dependent HD superfamily phosphohydrolase